MINRALKTACSFSIIFWGMLCCHPGFAAINPEVIKAALPGSTTPGRASQTFIPSYIQPKTTSPVKVSPSKTQSALGKEAARLKFKLKQIIVDGEQIYSEKQLLPIYKNKLNTVISVSELQEITENITNYYRNNGYILTRVVLPPQHINKGIVHVRVIEGFINKVKIVGNAGGAKSLLLAYGNAIAKSKPTQIKIMEHYLRLANEIPGLQVKAIIEPSKTTIGASDLDLAVESKKAGGSLSYDNYGTRYIGPQQITAVANVNSVIRSGDSTRMTYVRTPRPKELAFLDISHETPLGSNGMKLIAGGNISITRPEFVLTPAKIQGTAKTLYSSVRYPVMRTREANMTVEGGVNYLNSVVTALDLPLYTDHIRSLKANVLYDFSDHFSGENIINLSAEQGLNLLGATNNTNSTTTSRFGGRATFTKVGLDVNRSQLIHGRFSAFLDAKGQYAFNPLLSSVQFGFGGSQQGRGYDPAEIIGDRGAAGTVELRMNVYPGWRILQTTQLYTFYDAGVIWNLKDVANTPMKQSATSAGIGSRLFFTNYLSGNLMITQPLTKTVAAEALIGDGKKPRIFFSITASV